MNLEIKYHLTDSQVVRDILQRIGARCEKMSDQTDYYFNLPQGNPAAKMKYRIEGSDRTLVYYTRPNFKEGEGAPCNFSFVHDPDGTLFDILKSALGIWAVVQKKREEWRKESFIFHLDDVQEVGPVFEVEYVSQDPEKDHAIFDAMLSRFIPYLGDVAPSSNSDLVTAKNF